jgi:hypothetical protein
MGNQGQLQVERIGGFAGYGLPGSHLKSRGELSMSELSPADLQAVEALFQRKSQPAAPKPDGFVYRITKKSGSDSQTIEVPEDSVPMVIRNSVKDTLE